MVNVSTLQKHVAKGGKIGWCRKKYLENSKFRYKISNPWEISHAILSHPVMVINMLCAFPKLFLSLSCGKTLVPLVSHHADFFSKKSFRPFSSCRRLLPAPVGCCIWEFTGSHSLTYCSTLEWGRAADVCPTADWVKTPEKRGVSLLFVTRMVGFSAVSPLHAIAS